jgi:predicted MFS family arabinose efflux permease
VTAAGRTEGPPSAEGGDKGADEPNLGGRRADAFSAVLMSFVALQTVGVVLIPVVAPQLQDRFGMSEAQIGLLTSAFALAVAVTAIPLGLATARWGGRTLFFAAALFLAGSLVFAAADSYPWFLVGRFIQGLGAGAGMPVGTALITRLVLPSFRHRAFGLFGAGTGLGAVVTLLVTPSVAAAGGYRAVFIVAAGFVVVLAAAAAASGAIRSRPGSAGVPVGIRTLGRALAHTARSPGVLLVGVMNLTVVAVVVGVLTWTPQFLHDQHGSSLAIAAYLTAAIGVAQTVGNPLGAMAASRWGTSAVLVAGLALMALATALVPIGPGLVGAFAAVLVTVFLAGALLPPSLAVVADVAHGNEAVGAATGLIGMLNVVGSMFAPWVFGLLLDKYGTRPGRPGYTAGYLMLAGFALAGAAGAVAYVLRRRGLVAQPP